MIVCNGCPRTGTHLVMKFLGMLGLEDSGYILVRLAKHKPIGARYLKSETKKVTAPIEQVLNLDEDEFVHAHVMGRVHLPGHSVINTYRDPRDSAVSLVRWHRHRKKLPKHLAKKTDEALLIDLISNGYYSLRGMPWVEFVRSFEGGKHSNALVLQFEDLGTFGAARQIADYIQVDIKDEELQALVDEWMGNGKKWNGIDMHVSMSSQTPGGRSRWEDYWTAYVQNVWEETGGMKLLKDMGYTCPSK